MAAVEVCRLDELVEAKPLVLPVGGRDLVLVRWRGEVYAVRDVCPHMKASFALGSVIGHITGAGTGEVVIRNDEPVLTCPWHQYEFFLADGHCKTDGGLRVRSYPVEVVDGTVQVDLDGHRGRLPEPAEATA